MSNYMISMQIRSAVRQPARRGAAAVEFAMTVPLLFMLLFAALELGHANMVFNATEAACYEGARVGIVPGASADECRAAAANILEISRIRGANITVTPAILKVDSKTVEVEIALDYKDTAIMAPTFTRKLKIKRACELVREEL